MDTRIPSLLGCLHLIPFPSDWCVHCSITHLPCTTSDAGKYSRFAFDSCKGKGSDTKVPPLICNIVMPDMNQAAFLARECMFNSHMFIAAITLLRHVKWKMIVPQADVVTPLIR